VPIKPWNKTGYCSKHKYIGEAEVRMKTQVPTEPRFCQQPGCDKMLAPQNENGVYCTEHREPCQRIEPTFCKEPSCTNKKALRSDCKTGFCIAHRHLAKIPKRGFCKDCKKKLGGNNRIGYCKACRKIRFAEQDRDAAAKRTAAALADLRTKAAARPVNWWEKIIDWRIIGEELLSREGPMSNQELGERLDASRILKCPYHSDGWETALGRIKRAMDFVSEIRTWVKRPAKGVSRKQAA
jgi:hypothetical protein